MAYQRRDTSKSFLKQFKFKILNSYYFEELESSFWESENIIATKIYNKA